MAIEDMFTETFDVYPPRVTVDLAGAPKFNFAPTATGIPCRVEDASETTQELFMQKQMVVTHRILSQYNAVGNGYVLLIHDATSPDRVMRVQQAGKRRQIGNMDTFFSDMCEELRLGN